MHSANADDHEGANEATEPPPADRPRIVVIGDQISAAMADRLRGDYEVAVLTEDDAMVGRPRTRFVDTATGEVTDLAFLRNHAAPADAAVVATERDRTNLLVTQLLRTAVPVDRIVVRLNDPRRRDVFDDIQVEIVDGSAILAAEVSETLATGDA